MKTRLELQSKLEELLGSRNVYYQPPESVKMEYPAIVYKKAGFPSIKADNSLYKENTRYTIIVIDKTPDNAVIDEIRKLPYCTYDQRYASDNLYHDAMTLYL